jgi:DNA-binding MarR family transcriptional regulator
MNMPLIMHALLIFRGEKYTVQELNRSHAQEREYAILESIRRQAGRSAVRQRDLARTVGVSLGMTNVIVKKLVQRGWLLIRKVNNRNIHYVVTPAGVDELASRSFAFLKRTVRNVVVYKDILEKYLRGIQETGLSGIVLVGRSDFDFILAHLCQKFGIRFSQSERPPLQENSMLVFSEDYQRAGLKRFGEGASLSVSLRDILIAPERPADGSAKGGT